MTTWPLDDKVVVAAADMCISLRNLPVRLTNCLRLGKARRANGHCSFDADGNIISKSGNGKTWTYTWDPFDKLTDVKLNGVLVYHFVYDAFGNRVARCTTATCSAGEREINDGSQFVLARSSSGVITDAYGYYPGGDQPMSLQLPSGRTGVFITDPQLRGTVRAIADADKNATNPEFKTFDISPWGEVAADTGSITRLRMAGQQYDQGSELYYMRARYYDPQLGRFLSEDPIGISGGLNLYAYAGNDPVNNADPTGTSVQCGNVLYLYTTKYVDTGEITDMWYGTEYECHDVPDESGKGGGPGGAGETMGRAPADTTCTILGVPIPGLNSAVGLLGNWTFAIGLSLDAFEPSPAGGVMPGFTASAGFYWSRAGFGAFHTYGVGAGEDASVSVQGSISRNFFGVSEEGQLQAGNWGVGLSRTPGPGGRLDGGSFAFGLPATPLGGHLALTNTVSDFRIIKCE
jgi:RHS repeat-associated protein